MNFEFDKEELERADKEIEDLYYSKVREKKKERSKKRYWENREEILAKKRKRYREKNPKKEPKFDPELDRIKKAWEREKENKVS